MKFKQNLNTTSAYIHDGNISISLVYQSVTTRVQIHIQIPKLH